MNQDDAGAPTWEMSECRLLAVDDNEENLKLLVRILSWAGYEDVRTCTSAREALAILPSFRPDVVILDLMMPDMDGYEFLTECRDGSPDGAFLPILVFTADLTSEARTRALELGASDFLTKPGDAQEIKLRVRNFLRMRHQHQELGDQNRMLEAKVAQRSAHLVVAWKEAVEVLARACEYRDDNTGQHAHRVGATSAAIAVELGCDSEFVEHLRLAAPLHDIGKIAIPDEILHKPAALSDEEFAVMKGHAALGAEMVGKRTSPFLQMAEEIARFHHERWDGTGYSAGIAGEAIPLSARIVSVADAYDAMTNDRPYRKAGTKLQAMAELEAMAGKQFDPNVVAALVAHVRRSIGIREAA